MAIFTALVNINSEKCIYKFEVYIYHSVIVICTLTGSLVSRMVPVIITVIILVQNSMMWENVKMSLWVPTYNWGIYCDQCSLCLFRFVSILSKVVECTQSLMTMRKYSKKHHLESTMSITLDHRPHRVLQNGRLACLKCRLPLQPNNHGVCTFHRDTKVYLNCDHGNRNGKITSITQPSDTNYVILNSRANPHIML